MIVALTASILSLLLTAGPVAAGAEQIHSAVAVHSRLERRRTLDGAPDGLFGIDARLRRER